MRCSRRGAALAVGAALLTFNPRVDPLLENVERHRTVINQCIVKATHIESIAKPVTKWAVTVR